MHDRTSLVLRRTIVMLLAGLALAIPDLAKATPITQSDIPDAQYTNSVFGYIIGDSSSSQHQATGLPSSGLTVSGSQEPSFNATTSNNYAIPGISASAAAHAGAVASAQSALSYFVAFSGPDGPVQVNVQASGGVVSTGAATYLQLMLTTVGSGAEVISEYLDIGGGSQPLSLNQSLTLQANALYRVFMDTEAKSQGNGGAGYAYVDPYFSTPVGYSVLTSTGIGNASPVATTPIPAALPLFASGLGLLGLFGWYRNSAAASRQSRPRSRA